MSLLYRLLLVFMCGFVSINVLGDVISGIHNFNEQGAFDNVWTGSRDQLSHFIAVVKADIKKNEAILSYTQAGWFDRIWNFITQGTTGATAIGLSSYANYLIFSELNEHVQSFNFWKEQKDLMNRVNISQDEQAKELLAKKYQRFQDHYEKELLDAVDYSVQQRENSMFYWKGAQVLGAIGAIFAVAGVIFFGHKIYKSSKSLNELKNDALNNLEKDKIILEKLENIKSKQGIVIHE